MNPWKVILATVVIFTAGLITGSLGTRQLTRTTDQAKPTTLENPIQHWMLRDEYVRLLSQQVGLTAEQKEQTLKIVHESQQRVQLLTSLIEPEMREELKNTREKIRAIMTPEQKVRYEEFLKKRRPGRPEHKPGKPPSETNTPNQT